MKIACPLLIGALALGEATASTTAFALTASSPFAQDWTNSGLITTNDNWDTVPSIVGYLGDLAASSTTGVDPQTILTVGDGSVDVIANQTNPNTSTAGGVAEFEITNPTIALQGSATADFPNLVIYLNASGAGQITVSYLLRDIDGSADNSAQQVALQYRIGGSGDFVNVPGGYVSDASTGPSLATATTTVSALLPSEVNGASQLEVRIITTNAVGSDEWIGIDDITVTAATVPEPSIMLLGSFGVLALLRRRR